MSFVQCNFLFKTEKYFLKGIKREFFFGISGVTDLTKYDFPLVSVFFVCLFVFLSQNIMACELSVKEELSEEDRTRKQLELDQTRQIPSWVFKTQVGSINPVYAFLLLGKEWISFLESIFFLRILNSEDTHHSDCLLFALVIANTNEKKHYLLWITCNSSIIQFFCLLVLLIGYCKEIFSSSVNNIID